MDWTSVVLAGITTMLLVVLADLAGTGGKWCARLAERSGIVPRNVSVRDPDGRRTSCMKRHEHLDLRRLAVALLTGILLAAAARAAS